MKTLMLAGLLAAASLCLAQDPAGKQIRGEISAIPAVAPLGMTFEFVSADMGFSGQVVKAAPYSAQGVTETTQTLSDGNRIHHTQTSKIYRDAEGRTRREQTLDGLGPLVAAGNAPKLVVISDPVAGTNYVLEPENKIARKTPLPTAMEGRMVKNFAYSTTTSAATSGTFFAAVPPPPPGAAAGVQVMGFHKQIATPAEPLNVKSEQLGTQMIEGIQAQGTRSTVTIPAGQIGNDRPIDTVTERWYSSELQVVVMSKRSDPRAGETVYKLTNVDRSEPDPTLFQPPADYQVVEPQIMKEDVLRHVQ